jgi:hypothetical protein
MDNNIDKYRNDLEKLIKKGDKLNLSIRFECYPDKVKSQLVEAKGKKEASDIIAGIPSFFIDYQSWYSESLSVLKQLLPDRLDDFKRLFEKPKIARKNITYENYTIEDFLQGLVVTRSGDWGSEEVVGKHAAIPKFEQQLNIVTAIEDRFESSLYDIKQLLQADLFDSELSGAEELNKKGFVRGAGAIAGVVLENHLKQVCANHNLKISKKNSTINDLNELIKKVGAIEIVQFRFIQRLADLRNKCDHKKDSEPNREEIGELIEGVDKVVKTLY